MFWYQGFNAIILRNEGVTIRSDWVNLTTAGNWKKQQTYVCNNQRTFYELING